MPEYIQFSFIAEDAGNNVNQTVKVYADSLNVKWDTSNVDSLAAGVYTATAEPMEYLQFESIVFEPIQGRVEIIQELPQIQRGFYFFQDFVLKMDSQIPKDLPFEVRYKEAGENDWITCNKAKLDEAQRAITLPAFGELMGYEERKLVFLVSFKFPSEYRETDEFMFTGSRQEYDGGGDRDGGDQNDQGERVPVGIVIEEPENEGEEGGAAYTNIIADRISKMSLDNIFWTVERFLQQLSQILKDDNNDSAMVFEEEAQEIAAYNEIGEAIHTGETKTAGENQNMAAANKTADNAAPPASAQTTMLTGTDINRLIQSNPLFITFAEKDIRLLIPSEALKSLDLSESDTFQAELYKEEQEFSVRIFINGEEKTDWTDYPLQVYIKSDFKEDEVNWAYCYQDAEGRIQAEGMENDEIVFHITRAGNYTLAYSDEMKDRNANENNANENRELHQITRDNAPQKTERPLGPLAAGIIFISGVIFWLCYRIKR